MVQTKALKYLSEVFVKPEPVKNEFRYRDILFFSQFVKPLWKTGVIYIVLIIITTGLGSLLPLSSKVFIDFVIMKKSLHKVKSALQFFHLTPLFFPLQYVLGSLNLVILFILLTGIVITLIRIIQNILVLTFQQEITFNIQTALFDHLLRFPMVILKGKQVGYLMARVSHDVDILQYFFSQAAPQLLTNSFYFLFSFGILFTLNTRFSLLLVSLIPAWGFINYFFSARMRAISHQSMEKQADISKDMQEMISGIEVIKAHVSEKREVGKLSARIRALFRTQIKSRLLNSLSHHAMNASKAVMTLLIVWLSVHEIQKGCMTIGDMTALISYVIYLSGLAQGFSSTFLMLQNVFAGMERLIEMFTIIPEFMADEKEENLIRPQKLRGEIRFLKVSFFYEKKKSVLNNITFTVSPGEIIALKGASGAGKTTLVNLLIKFYFPRSGSIYLDDYNMKDIDTRWLREQIGFVSQDTFLFNDTIENNIKYGKPSATSAEVSQAAKRANILHDIEKFPQGYQTLVGERGMKLSAGQRQRISIARAFLKDPPILIFDEPTSALDPVTQAGLKNSLKDLSPNRTIFLITHHMAINDVATRIFILEDGRIKIRQVV